MVFWHFVGISSDEKSTGCQIFKQKRPGEIDRLICTAISMSEASRRIPFLIGDVCSNYFFIIKNHEMKKKNNFSFFF